MRAGIILVHCRSCTSWFRSDVDCLDYLDWLCWPDGFVCPGCSGVGEWPAAPGKHRCSECSRRASVTAGTVFHRTCAPLTVCFEAAWLMTVSNQGICARTLQRTTGQGSYQRAWMMLHKFRTVRDPSTYSRLSGDVEVDQTFIGGVKPGIPGRGAAGKTLVAGAVECRGAGLGRVRLKIIADACAPSLSAFLRANVAPGSRVISDGWLSYRPACSAAGLLRTAHKVAPSGLPAHVFLPGVHRLFSLVKRVLEGTCQGSVQPEQLQGLPGRVCVPFQPPTLHPARPAVLQVPRSRPDAPRPATHSRRGAGQPTVANQKPLNHGTHMDSHFRVNRIRTTPFMPGCWVRQRAPAPIWVQR